MRVKEKNYAKKIILTGIMILALFAGMSTAITAAKKK